MTQAVGLIAILSLLLLIPTTLLSGLLTDRPPSGTSTTWLAIRWRWRLLIFGSLVAMAGFL
jgi:hypothetical protein